MDHIIGWPKWSTPEVLKRGSQLVEQQKTKMAKEYLDTTLKKASTNYEKPKKEFWNRYEGLD